MRNSQTLSLLFVAATFLLPNASDAGRRHRGDLSICQATARQLSFGCELEAKEDRHVGVAKCFNVTDPDEQDECYGEVREEFAEIIDECNAQHEARFALCLEPGMAGAYDPDVDPDNFVVGIDNPYAPFRPGSVWIYEKDGEEGIETIQVEVLPDTFEIEGIECTQVRDRAWVDGQLIEDTTDWVAQDVDGNVWYIGEISKNFEDGQLKDLEGSWVFGDDGAKPGYWVKADPMEGEFFRQEYLPGDAEDIVEVTDTDSDVVVPFANGNPVLETRDFTPLEPDAEEFKYYVPGVGLVMEVDPESGEVLKLISYTP